MSSFSVSTHTVQEVQDYVNGLPPEDLPAEAQRLLDGERLDKMRVTLMNWLDAMLGVI